MFTYFHLCSLRDVATKTFQCYSRR